MKRLGPLLVAVLTLTGLTAPLLHAQAHGSVAEQYLFAMANAERTQRGLQPLRWDPRLYLAAQTHCREMADRASISHQYPGEAELSERGRIAGAKFSRIAENVAEAPTAVRIHDAWMNSPGHKANLLDPNVDSIAISVLARDGQLYAVQDFDRSVASLSYAQQESTIGSLMLSVANVHILPTTEDIRRTCSMDSGHAGPREPWFVMRFTAGDLNQLPADLKTQLASGKYTQAAVGACASHDGQPFTSYNIAVLLYP